MKAALKMLLEEKITISQAAVKLHEEENIDYFARATKTLIKISFERLSVSFSSTLLILYLSYLLIIHLFLNIINCI